MAKIGMIGGLGPESTVDYYKLIISAFKKEISKENYPEIVIYSMNMTNLLGLMAGNKLEEAARWLAEGVNVLEGAGADFAFISSNTPHAVFNIVRGLSNIPIISIVEETCKYIKKSGFTKVGLLGTKFTMQSDFYQKVFDKADIEIVLPTIDEQQYIHGKLMDEIEVGIILDETKDGLLKIIKRMKDENSIQAVILGCTELPLILRGNMYGIPFLNTSSIHVNSVIEYLKNI